MSRNDPEWCTTTSSTDVHARECFVTCVLCYICLRDQVEPLQQTNALCRTHNAMKAVRIIRGDQACVGDQQGRERPHFTARAPSQKREYCSGFRLKYASRRRLPSLRQHPERLLSWRTVLLSQVMTLTHILCADSFTSLS